MASGVGGQMESTDETKPLLLAPIAELLLFVAAFVHHS